MVPNKTFGIQRLAEAYTHYERSEVQRVFRAFDEDGSGSLDTEEIEQVMCSFNITPFRSTVEASPVRTQDPVF